jgi:hypothetical protein
MNKGPWDRLKEDEQFRDEEGRAGAAFYPEDMTKDYEFEKYVAAHPRRRTSCRACPRSFAATAAISQGSRTRRPTPSFQPAAAKLREAAALTTNASLKISDHARRCVPV